MTETGLRISLVAVEEATRVDGTIDVVCPASDTDYVVCCYFQGAGAALGKISPAKWYAVTSMV